MTDTTNRFKEWKRNFFVWCDTFLNSEDQTSLQAEGFNHLKPSLASSKLSFFLFLKILQNITQLGFSCLGSCRIQRIKVCKRGLSSTECSPRNSIVGPESLFQMWHNCFNRARQNEFISADHDYSLFHIHDQKEQVNLLLLMLPILEVFITSANVYHSLFAGSLVLCLLCSFHLVFTQKWPRKRSRVTV